MKYSSGRVERRKAPHKGWRAVLDYEEGGKRKRKTKTLDARTKTEANRMMNVWWAEMEKAVEEAPEPAPATEVPTSTLAEVLAAHIERAESVGAISPRTATDYRTALARVPDEVAGTPVARLTGAQLAQMEARLSERYAPHSVRKVHSLVKAALGAMARDGVLPRNPMDGVKGPPNRNARPGINALDSAARERLKAVLADAVPCPGVMAATVSLYTGLRRGEVCGLRWQDVDLDRGTMWVRRSIEVVGGKVAVKGTKTGRDRDVAIPDTLAEAMRGWRDSGAAGDVYVIGSGDGYARPDAVSHEWSALAKALDLRGTEGRLCTFHDLRHTWATAAVAAGIDIKTVSSNLGHANAAMTLNIYASADPEAKRRAAEVMDSVI